jgi:ketosteroid isomerase-like protein
MGMALAPPAAFARRFVQAVDNSDMANVLSSFAPDVLAFITNASGGTDFVEGSEALGHRFPDFAAMADSFHATVTQAHEIDDRTVLIMAEIRAERLGRSLHNFAGILIRLDDEGRMAECRMVEALASESDRFWSA